MKKLYFFLLLLAGLSVFAQGENDNWYFNYNDGLNFSNGTTTPLYGGQLTSLEATAAISRPNGDLLFYTDGATIWNREHQVMLNGTGLSGDTSSQQVIISPYPGNSNLYYVFTMAHVYGGTFGDTSPGGFSAYSIVDMSIGNTGTDGLPLGGVDTTAKNIPLLNELGFEFTYYSENIASTPRADGQSYWIVFYNGGKLYSYNLDSDGFHNTPVVSNVPAPVDPVETHMHLRISPDLSPNLDLPYTNLISITRWPGGLNLPNPNYGTRVFSFDNNTGLITSDYLFVQPAYASYSSEFSASGQILYQGTYVVGEILAFDLFTPNVANIRRSILQGSVGRQCGSVQRARNGEIYINFKYNPPDTGYLAKIDNSESFLTSSVNFNGAFIDTPGGIGTRLGLPPLVPILSPDGCWHNLTLGFPEASSIVRQVSETITTNNLYKVSAGQNVNLKGGNYVLLKPNTIIETGAVFVAEIDGCTTPSSKPAKLNSQNPVRIFLNENNEASRLAIFPNPAITKTEISVPDSSITDITVYTKEGNLIFKGKGNNSNIYNLDVSGYDKGIYLISVTTDKGEVITDKIIKN